MADRLESKVVEQSLPNERLDVYLREQFPMVSRGYLQKLIEEGDIKVNGAKVKATHAPKAGEKIDIRWPEARTMETKAENIPLEVLFEDEDLVVLNKAP